MNEPTTTIDLETLKSVPPREIWKNEAQDFTPWLAANIDLLFEEIGVTAENVKTEERAGRFIVDITAEDSQTEKNIIIENQLGQTNHDHLGKLLTYASSFDASIIVWIVGDITDEHQRAIEWFNDHMDDEISFFLVRIEAYKIGDSKPAPKFNAVVQPNSWSKIIRRSTTSNTEITSTKLAHLRFWEGLKEYASDSKTSFTVSQKPTPRQWYNISIGSREAHLRLSLNSVNDSIQVAIYISKNPALFEHLNSKQSVFNERVKSKIEWLPLQDKEASLISCTYEGDPHEEKRQGEYYMWILETSEQLFQAFNEGNDSFIQNNSPTNQERVDPEPYGDSRV